MTTTPTPRTDAFASAKYANSCAAASMGNAPGVSGYEESPEDAYADAIDFARQLERENVELRAALTAAHGAFSVLIQYADDSDGSCYGTLSTGLVRAVIGQVDGRALVEPQP